MKDAKGHGSDPRGAHQAGIANVGKTQMMDISALVPTQRIGLLHKSDPDYKTDTATINYFRAKIRKGEPIEPVIVRPNGYVYDGHHRISAHVAEGHTKIPTVTKPWEKS